jgi:anaerobic selenocysteine-containing dehydrogenase
MNRGGRYQDHAKAYKADPTISGDVMVTNMTKAHTTTNYRLLSLLPKNPVLMNALDAERLGLRDSDRVRLISASNPDGVWDL